MDLIQKAEIPANDSAFIQRVFSLVAAEKKKRLLKDESPLQKVILEEYNTLSSRADRSLIQESCSIRNVLTTRNLALELIDKEGRLDEKKLTEAITLLKENLYPLGPKRQHDKVRREHILESLQKLQASTELKQLLKSIHKPETHRIAEAVVRDTLQLPQNTHLTDAHAKQAALSAWLCYLRQSVGSCFATAPAIIIHDEQPEQFFRDIKELLATGQLKRTYEGVEYSVPLSPSWGTGDFKRLFFIQCEKDGGQIELWLSPGLLAAFEALDLVDSNLPLRNRIQETKTLVQNYIKDQCQEETQILTSTEEIINYCLMKHLKITPKNLEEYKHETPTMVAVGGLIQISSTSNKAHLLKQFYTLQEKARNAFKALADNALLKTWEFTIASFAESKPVFTRWNLYSSLGLQPNQPGGIGECLYIRIKEKLDRQNQIVQDLNEQYEQVYPHIRYLETRLRTASTEKEINWLKIEYNTRVHEFRSLEESRNQAQALARWYANLLNVFIAYYDKLFPQYFQEIYDADMHDIGPNPYDDSPAGFRLIYKHGRTNTSQWTRINTPNEFIEALANFFNASEREMIHAPEFEGQEKELSELVTAVVNHVRTQQFLETAFDRMAIAHGTHRIANPLQNLDKIEKKPWVYTSGGSLDNLAKNYWCRETNLTEQARWVENQTELFVFLVDTLKQVANKTLDLYAANPKKSMLIHSPTHAFLLKPGLLKEAWTSKEFTYTWIRDKIILPRDHFIDRIKLDSEKMEFLIEELTKKIPLNYRHYFRRVFANITWGTTNPTNFRNDILKNLHQERGLQFKGTPVLSIEDLDHTLYETLPLLSISELDYKIKDIIQNLPGMKNKNNEIENAIDSIKKTIIGTRIISAKQLIEMCIAIVLITLKETMYPIDYHTLIIKSAREFGYCMPEPIIIGDTNWVKDNFAFLVNPGTAKLELWRTDTTGSSGFPMTNWEQWLNGSRHDRTWGVYIQPHEYISPTKKTFFL